jgi:two-component system cell cycle sensor histidine kinase/response regulator CckA
VVNARDAMPQGGKLTLETSVVELDQTYVRDHGGARAGSYVRLSISDNGVGMSREIQERVFEPFFTTKELGRGTGLGLSTVYGIVQQTGGHVEVSSAPGVGTTFHVYLPRASEIDTSDGSAMADAGPVPNGPETVLLVEDEIAVRNLASKILTKLGYKVLVANDGLEAIDLEASYQGPIHLLISDVVMPRLSGAELARRLLERRPGLPVMFFSGYTPDAALYPKFPEGGPTLLPKPFTAETLGRAARDALDRGRRAASLKA